MLLVWMLLVWVLLHLMLVGSVRHEEIWLRGHRRVMLLLLVWLRIW
jgi:hypothetical protein